MPHHDDAQPDEDVAADEDIETTFRRLRTQNYSRLDALRVILDTLDVSLSEAKELLLHNDTWAEARAAAESRRSSGTDTHSAYDTPTRPAPAD